MELQEKCVSEGSRRVVRRRIPEREVYAETSVLLTEGFKNSETKLL